jgi:RHH-type transcriptional regulator, rel operon repressor / antitoxin RelB
MPLSVSVRLPEKTARALDKLASATDRSRTYLIVRALEAYLADHANYQVAVHRLRDKDDPVISCGELRRRIGRKDWIQGVSREGSADARSCRGSPGREQA